MIKIRYNCRNIDDFLEKEYEEGGFIISLGLTKDGKKYAMVKTLATRKK